MLLLKSSKSKYKDEIIKVWNNRILILTLLQVQTVRKNKI